MTEQSVSDLVFRDFDPGRPAVRSDAEREAAVREELDKLRAGRRAPRVVPVARPSAAEQRFQ
jgi:hypothetical protein